jgi:very-short-patch-repair endonuclease
MSGPGAAYRHGLLDRTPDEIEVTVPRRLGPGHYPGVRVRRRDPLAFPKQKVAVEVDGWAWHVDAERFRNDRRKQNALVGAGWDPLRFTWHDLDGRPATVVEEIQATLGGA